MHKAYELLLGFDTDEPEFVRGFESGRVWGELGVADTDRDLTFTVHAENAEMMLRIAEAHGLTVRSEDLDERWITVTFTEQS